MDVRDTGSIPIRVRKIPGGGPGNPLQYSCLENPKDRGAWWATVHRVALGRTRLKRLSTHNTHTRPDIKGVVVTVTVCYQMALECLSDRPREQSVPLWWFRNLDMKRKTVDFRNHTSDTDHARTESLASEPQIINSRPLAPPIPWPIGPLSLACLRLPQPPDEEPGPKALVQKCFFFLSIWYFCPCECLLFCI